MTTYGAAATEGDRRAAAAGIHRIAVHTPFQVGPVNAYLIEDEPLTLLDSGPNSARALHELEQGLAATGHRVEELELLVVSHQHMDHFGLVEVLRQRSGAQVAALELLAPYLEHYFECAEADDDFGAALLRQHGVPADLSLALRQVSRAFRGWGANTQVDRRLRAGGQLELAGRALEIQHRPGHSPTDTVFWDPARAIALAADHLLAAISSNPLISRPPTVPDGEHAPLSARERPHALLAYVESLRRTRELPAEVVLAGHGEPVLDHRGLIDERLRMQARRQARILRLLTGGPRTVFELAQAMWGNIAVTQAYLTLSELLGHLDVLIDQGRVRERLDEDFSRFEAL